MTSRARAICTAAAVGVALVAGIAPAAAANSRRRRRGGPARHRTSGSERLPPRSHAPVLRARDQARRGLHRAGPRGHQGRSPDRAPRAEHHHHNRRRQPPRVRLPPAYGDGGRGHGAGLVRLGLHARRDQDAARGAAAGRAPTEVQRQVPDPDARRGDRPGQAGVAPPGPPDRHLSRDQAPDVPRGHRAAARGQAREGASQGRLELTPRPRLHPVLRAVQPQAAEPDDRGAARPARRRQRRESRRDARLHGAVRPAV